MLKLNKNFSSSIYKGSLYSIFSFLSKGINFILLLIVAKLISTEDYGSLNLITTIITFFGYIICAGGEGYFSVTYFNKCERERVSIMTSLFYIPLIIYIILLSIISIVFIFFNLSFIGFSFLDIFISLTISLFSVYIYLCLEYYRVKEQIFKYGFLSSIYGIINLLITLVLIISFHYSWHGRLYAMLISALVISIYSVIFLYRSKSIQFTKASFKTSLNIIKWGVPLIPHQASVWIRQGLDRYIINSFYSLSQVGIFSFALNISSVMCVIGLAFNSSNSIDLFKKLSNQEKDEVELINEIKSYTKLMLILYFIIAVIATIIIPIIIKYFFQNYSTSLPYFYLLVPYGYLQCVYFLYCNYLFYFHKNSAIMKITFFTSIAHLILSILFSRYSLFFTAILYSIIQLVIIVLIRIKVINILKLKYKTYKADIIL